MAKEESRPQQNTAPPKKNGPAPAAALASAVAYCRYSAGVAVSEPDGGICGTDILVA